MPANPDTITPEQIEQVYRTLIHPTVFSDSPGGEHTPTLILLGGQAGSGKSRASARLLAEHDGMVAVSGDDLRSFHPNYRELVTGQPEQAGPILAEATRPWVRAVIQDCLDERRSLLLEGSFGDPDVTLATASRFQDAGFKVRIVALASPRVLSLVTAASRYLRDLKIGAPARVTSLAAHDRGFDGTTRLIGLLAADAAVDRVTILSRSGQVLSDRSQNATDTGASFADASSALTEGRQPMAWGARSTMELLGELKQITTFAVASGELGSQVAGLLVEAYERTRADVLPHLSVDADSPQAQFIQQAVTEQLVALRRAASQEQTLVVQDFASTPEVSPAIE